MDSNKLAV